MLTLKKELWKDIPGYEGIYQISDAGRVKRLIEWCGNKDQEKWVPCNKILNATDNGNGYKIVGLSWKNSRKNHYVHRLVAEAFIEKEDGKNHINHKDHNRENNHVENLEWCTPKENVLYSVPRMCHPKNSKLGESGEKYIRKRQRKKGVTFEVGYLNFHKTFKSMENAIKYRNEVVSGG